MSISEFGTLKDGTLIREARLTTAAGAEACVIELGATLRDLVVPLGDGSSQRVVLGFPSLDAYPSQTHHAGSIAGRFANRIAKGRFPLDGHIVEVPRNNGENSLHGGTSGFNKRVWSVAAHDAASATLAMVSPDGDQGYPGTLRVWCRYELVEPSTLVMDIAATTDKPTVVNLANHSYFNLDGSDDARDHELTLDACFYTPADAGLIPTGEVRSVAGTPYDFREARTIRGARSGDTPPGGYDINFVLRRSRVERHGGLDIALAATLRSPENRLTLEIWTSEPGIQLFDCHAMTFAPTGNDGRSYGNGAGIALEAQLFPDAPNRPHFPSAMLRPGETYRQRTEYRFIAGDR